METLNDLPKALILVLSHFNHIYEYLTWLSLKPINLQQTINYAENKTLICVFLLISALASSEAISRSDQEKNPLLLLLTVAVTTAESAPLQSNTSSVSFLKS